MKIKQKNPINLYLKKYWKCNLGKQKVKKKFNKLHTWCVVHWKQQFLNLNPERRLHALAMLRHKQNFFVKQEIRSDSETDDEEIVGLFKCPACKSFKVDYTQVQLRSSDEPMSSFCACKKCGKRWREN